MGGINKVMLFFSRMARSEVTDMELFNSVWQKVGAQIARIIHTNDKWLVTRDGSTNLKNLIELFLFSAKNEPEITQRVAQSLADDLTVIANTRGGIENFLSKLYVSPYYIYLIITNPQIAQQTKCQIFNAAINIWDQHLFELGLEKCVFLSKDLMHRAKGINPTALLLKEQLVEIEDAAIIFEAALTSNALTKDELAGIVEAIGVDRLSKIFELKPLLAVTLINSDLVSVSERTSFLGTLIATLGNCEEPFDADNFIMLLEEGKLSLLQENDLIRFLDLEVSQERVMFTEDDLEALEYYKQAYQERVRAHDDFGDNKKRKHDGDLASQSVDKKRRYTNDTALFSKSGGDLSEDEASQSKALDGPSKLGKP